MVCSPDGDVVVAVSPGSRAENVSVLLTYLSEAMKIGELVDEVGRGGAILHGFAAQCSVGDVRGRHVVATVVGLSPELARG